LLVQVGARFVHDSVRLLDNSGSQGLGLPFRNDPTLDEPSKTLPDPSAAAAHPARNRADDHRANQVMHWLFSAQAFP
jgi:hypothetical protein